MYIACTSCHILRYTTLYFESGWSRLANPFWLCRTLAPGFACSSIMPFLSLHDGQAPQAGLASPKRPQPRVDFVDIYRYLYISIISILSQLPDVSCITTFFQIVSELLPVHCTASTTQLLPSILVVAAAAAAQPFKLRLTGSPGLNHYRSSPRTLPLRRQPARLPLLSASPPHPPSPFPGQGARHLRCGVRLLFTWITTRGSFRGTTWLLSSSDSVTA